MSNVSCVFFFCCRTRAISFFGASRVWEKNLKMLRVHDLQEKNLRFTVFFYATYATSNKNKLHMNGSNKKTSAHFTIPPPPPAIYGGEILYMIHSKKECMNLREKNRNEDGQPLSLFRGLCGHFDSSPLQGP